MNTELMPMETVNLLQHLNYVTAMERQLRHKSSKHALFRSNAGLCTIASPFVTI